MLKIPCKPTHPHDWAPPLWDPQGPWLPSLMCDVALVKVVLQWHWYSFWACVFYFFRNCVKKYHLSKKKKDFFFWMMIMILFHLRVKEDTTKKPRRLKPREHLKRRIHTATILDVDLVHLTHLQHLHILGDLRDLGHNYSLESGSMLHWRFELCPNCVFSLNAIANFLFLRAKC